MSDTRNQELYCYLRVSTKTQEDEGNSIENQRFLGQRLCKKLGMTYVELNEGGFTSNITSTEELLKSPRPKFEELKQGIQIGRVKHLWYYSRSRYVRDDLEDGLLRRFYFQKYNVRVLEGVNGEERKFGTSQERFMDKIFTTVQEFDKDQRREISVGGKRFLSRSQGDTGVFMGGTMNFGYTPIDKKWSIEKTESEWVTKIFQMYLQGIPLIDIKTHLDSNGVSPRRSKLWSIGTLNTMLRNRVYIGEYIWKDKESGEEFKIVIPKIISHSLFKRVQTQIKKNTKNFGNNMRKYESLLTNLLVCSCGENITGQVKMTLNHKSYGCRSTYSKLRGKLVNDCFNRRTMNMDKTDELVIMKIQEVVGNSSEMKERFKSDIMKNKGVEEKKLKDQSKTKEKQIDRLDQQIESVIQSISSNEVNLMLGTTDERVHKSVKEMLEEELGNLEDRKKGYIQEIEDLDNQKDWIDWIGKFGQKTQGVFEKVTSQYLEGIVDEIVVSPSMGVDRDNNPTQIGHKFKMTFKLPIVQDGIEYVDPKDKSKGYTVVKGTKTLKVDVLPISKGGRIKKK